MATSTALGKPTSWRGVVSADCSPAVPEKARRPPLDTGQGHLLSPQPHPSYIGLIQQGGCFLQRIPTLVQETLSESPPSPAHCHPAGSCWESRKHSNKHETNSSSKFTSEKPDSVLSKPISSAHEELGHIKSQKHNKKAHKHWAILVPDHDPLLLSSSVPPKPCDPLALMKSNHCQFQAQSSSPAPAV